MKEIKRTDIPEDGSWAELEDGKIYYRWFYPDKNDLNQGISRDIVPEAVKNIFSTQEESSP